MNLAIEQLARFLADRHDEFSWNWLDDDQRERYRVQARQFFDDLADTHAVVELPKPASIDEDGVHIFRDSSETGPFYEGNHEVELVTSPGSGAVEIQPGWEISPEGCVDIAGQYLAAAKVANR